READALARFDELCTSSAERLPPAARALAIENAATRAAERFREAWEALDFERFAALHAPGLRNLDRRPVLRTDLDRDQFLDSFRPIFASAARVDVPSALLATRGDRLALCRMSIIGVFQGESGPAEVAFLQIFEVDALGRIVAGFGFDPDE